MINNKFGINPLTVNYIYPDETNCPAYYITIRHDTVLGYSRLNIYTENLYGEFVDIPVDYNFILDIYISENTRIPLFKDFLATITKENPQNTYKLSDKIIADNLYFDVIKVTPYIGKEYISLYRYYEYYSPQTSYKLYIESNKTNGQDCLFLEGYSNIDNLPLEADKDVIITVNIYEDNYSITPLYSNIEINLSKNNIINSHILIDSFYSENDLYIELISKNISENINIKNEYHYIMSNNWIDIKLSKVMDGTGNTDVKVDFQNPTKSQLEFSIKNIQYRGYNNKIYNDGAIYFNVKPETLTLNIKNHMDWGISTGEILSIDNITTNISPAYDLYYDYKINDISLIN